MNTESSRVLDILISYLTNNIRYLNETISAFVTSNIDQETIESFKLKHFVDETVLRKCIEFIYNKAKKYK